MQTWTISSYDYRHKDWKTVFVKCRLCDTGVGMPVMQFIWRMEQPAADREDVLCLDCAAKALDSACTE
jgi:hypothetical protein